MVSVGSSLHGEVGYTNLSALDAAIKAQPIDGLVFTGVSESDFDKLTEARESGAVSKFRLKHYDARLEQLIVTIPTKPHETAITRFNEHMRTLIHEDLAANVGATTYKTNSHLLSTREADAAWLPIPEREGEAAWPTLVIEVGLSQSLPKLREAKDWWLQRSNKQVNVVVLIKIHELQHTIVIEKWTRSSPSTTPRPTRSTVSQPTIREQEVHITTMDGVSFQSKEAMANFDSYKVTRAPLIFDHEELFLRARRQGEPPILYDERRLKKIASRVWIATS